MMSDSWVIESSSSEWMISYFDKFLSSMNLNNFFFLISRRNPHYQRLDEE